MATAERARRPYTITCRRCERSWEVTYEVITLHGLDGDLELLFLKGAPAVPPWPQVTCSACGTNTSSVAGPRSGPKRAPGDKGVVKCQHNQPSAEFLGTFVLICFGDGVVAMAVAALNQSGRGTAIFAASGDWLLITWGWAMAVTFGVYVAGGISGAHINPAVSLALAA